MAAPLPPPRKRSPIAASAVVDLALARDARRLRDFQARCRGVDEVNRKSLSRLFQTGLIFTRHGARLGRELLLAHQHLLRVTDLLARVGELTAAAPAWRSGPRAGCWWAGSRRSSSASRRATG